MSRPWLVTGGDGQLGRCLVSELSSRGIEHVAVDRADLDIVDPIAVESFVADIEPTVVVNTAAWTAVDDAEDHESLAASVNTDGARNVARSARRAGAALVHVSTDYVFDGQSGVPYDEEAPMAPSSAYGRTKAAGETAVRDEHGDTALIVRTAWLYSRHGRNFCKTMVGRALAGESVRVVADQSGQPTHAGDLAVHIADLVASGAPAGTYHGTNSGAATWHEFATEIFRLCGADVSLVSPCGTGEYPTRAHRPANSVLGHRRTREAGVTEMPPWRDALAGAISGIIHAVRSEQS